VGKARIVNNYSETTQKAWRAMLAVKMQWLNDRDNPELRDKFLSMNGLVQEMFEKEDNERQQ
jgi:hypothetical protein